MCFNLQHKEYWIYNKQATKEEYESFMADLGSRTKVEEYKKYFDEWRSQFPQKFMHGVQSENVTGDYIYNCKNMHNSFDCNDCQDCRYMYQSVGVRSKDCMDCDQCGEYAEMLYESGNSVYNVNRVYFSQHILDQSHDVYYSDRVHGSSDIFGCIGMKRKKFCILNKQYTPEEYYELVPKIIEHIKKDGQWGKTFPEEISCFGYNESLAQFYHPLTQEQALARGYKWMPEEQTTQGGVTPPDHISEVSVETIAQQFSCTTCNKSYRVLPQELSFYRTHLIPIPGQCFTCRNLRRKMQRNPRTLFPRVCSNCNVELLSSYRPDRSEKILCENCYQQNVY